MNRYLFVKSIVAVFICFMLFAVFSYSLFNSVPCSVIISFFINIIVYTVLIIKSLQSYKFSLDFIHSFFMLYMMTFAPLMQYSTTGTFLSYQSNPFKIIIINFAMLIWTLFFYLGRNSIKRQDNSSVKYINEEIKISNSIEYIMTFLMVILSLNRLRVAGFSVFRNSSAQTSFTGTGFSVLLFAIRISIVMVAVSISIYKYKCTNKLSICFFVNLALCLIIAFPTAVPRFIAATIYGGIFLMLFDSLKKNYIYPLTLLLGFIIIFPMLSNFRYESDNINLLELINHVTSNFKNEYNTGNYDGYMMLLRTENYVENNHIMLGYSLFGNILFFIPRSFWPSKPIGSGAFIAEYFDFSFTNSSESLVAESYLNFGIIGILIYAFLLGKLTKKMDCLYWQNADNLFVKLTYAFYIHLFMILLRGDFMTGFLYISIMTLIFILFYKLLRIDNDASVKIERINEAKVITDNVC